MNKNQRSLRAIDQITLMGQGIRKTEGYPKTIEEAIQRGDEMFEAVAARNARQKEMLSRASRLMQAAVDECTCGGVERAMSQITKEELDRASSAPDAEGH